MAGKGVCNCLLIRTDVQHSVSRAMNERWSRSIFTESPPGFVSTAVGLWADGHSGGRLCVWPEPPPTGQGPVWRPPNHPALPALADCATIAWGHTLTVFSSIDHRTYHPKVGLSKQVSWVRANSARPGLARRISRHTILIQHLRLPDKQGLAGTKATALHRHVFQRCFCENADFGAPLPHLNLSHYHPDV